MKWKKGGKKTMVRDPKSVTFVKVATCHVLHLATTLHAIVCGNILQNSN
jgi:hypothetical protein